jgi:hypothetical protein
MIAVKTELFPLGAVSFSPSARQALHEACQSETDLLAQHQGGAWEDMPHVQADNLAALSQADWICSSFDLPTGKTLWLITDPERASTIALLEGP